MHHIVKLFALAFLVVLMISCSSQQGSQDSSSTDSDPSSAQTVTADVAATGNDASLLIKNEPCYDVLLLDADGNINYSARTILHKHPNLTFHYQRVGCCSDTCHQEIVTYAAVQYPKDSVLQTWLADVLASFYEDASRQSDILVNGEKIEDNGEGEMVIRNVGCQPYHGILSDGGKQMFDYYQARMWVIGKNRDNEHGPAGRYGCVFYRCWESRKVASYFVAYSTSDVNNIMHQVVSFDRATGRKLDLVDVVREDCIAELKDLLAEEARRRHYQLQHLNDNELALEDGACDYANQLDVVGVGLTQQGLAVSTSALAFDQWANATHILVLPYERVAGLLVDELVR